MHRLYCNIICFVLAFSSQLQPVSPLSEKEPAVLSKEDILAGVESVRSLVEDLSVSYTFNATKIDPASTAIKNSREYVVVKGDKAFLDIEHMSNRREGKPPIRRIAAYNGKRTTLHLIKGRAATVHSQRYRETETRMRGFFDLMMLNPPRLGNESFIDMSLVSILRCEHSRLRPYLEVINGRYCHVVDRFLPEEGRLIRTVWIDIERGFLPLRLWKYGGAENKVYAEYTIDEAAEINGVWFPVLGHKRILPGVVKGMDNELEYVMEVDGYRTGQPSIAVNTGVKDDLFDLWKRLPLGTRLWDKDVDIAWTVGGDDYSSLAEAVELSLKGMDLPVPERAEKSPAVERARLPGLHSRKTNVEKPLTVADEAKEPALPAIVTNHDRVRALFYVVGALGLLIVVAVGILLRRRLRYAKR